MKLVPSPRGKRFQVHAHLPLATLRLRTFMQMYAKCIYR